jgi:signal transduction histidine kinase
MTRLVRRCIRDGIDTIKLNLSGDIGHPRAGADATPMLEPEVRAAVDALRLEQVIANLLDNALKFSPDGGRIEVELSTPTAGTVCLAVRDYGLGIPPERRGRIFDRFYQAHAEEHRSGLGVGLYVSRGIVQLHGGRIWAEFPPDGGTRFVVSLPTGMDGAPRKSRKPSLQHCRSSSSTTTQP